MVEVYKWLWNCTWITEPANCDWYSSMCRLCAHRLSSSSRTWISSVVTLSWKVEFALKMILLFRFSKGLTCKSSFSHPDYTDAVFFQPVHRLLRQNGVQCRVINGCGGANCSQDIPYREWKINVKCEAYNVIIVLERLVNIMSSPTYCRCCRTSPAVSRRLWSAAAHW